MPSHGRALDVAGDAWPFQTVHSCPQRSAGVGAPKRAPRCASASSLGRRKSGGLQTMRLSNRPAGAVARSDRPRRSGGPVYHPGPSRGDAKVCTPAPNPRPHSNERRGRVLTPADRFRAGQAAAQRGALLRRRRQRSPRSPARSPHLLHYHRHRHHPPPPPPTAAARRRRHLGARLRRLRRRPQGPRAAHDFGVRGVAGRHAGGLAHAGAPLWCAFARDRGSANVPPGRASFRDSRACGTPVHY